MKKFIIKSNSSDLILTLSEIRGDCFQAKLSSDHLSSFREVWAYADAYGFTELFENLVSYNKPKVKLDFSPCIVTGVGYRDSCCWSRRTT
jgi:hypothetical protein